MANVNKVILVGNLTRDPEVRYTAKGTAVTDISLAVNRFLGQEAGGGQETTFIDVTLWGRQAEVAGQYLGKGRQAYIEGRLQLDTWDDKQTGQKRQKLKVVGENLQLLGGPGGGQGGSPQGGGYQSQPQAQQAPPQNQAPMGGSPAPMDSFEDEDDIPF